MRGQFSQTVRVSRGGQSTKIHWLADVRDRIVAFALTPGNIADISMALPLMDAVRPTQRLNADKAYDVDPLRAWLIKHDIEPFTPDRTTCDTVCPLICRAYGRCNNLARMFG